MSETRLQLDAHTTGAVTVGADGLRHLWVRGAKGEGSEVGTAVRDALARLRAYTARGTLVALDPSLDLGFRVEDARAVEVRYSARSPDDAAEIVRQLRRILPARCTLALLPTDQAAPLLLDAHFAERDGSIVREPYVHTADGRLQVEAFELHVVEQCNLRCAHCCNMSPYLDDRVLAVAEIEAQCTHMARHLSVDVFKVTGGEPLLHPDITGVLTAVRRSGIAPVVRLFTNGLLLHQMDDAFWQALDQLTISNYASAPVKRAQLDEVARKARAFDVLVNVKPVAEFNQVMASCRHQSDAAVQAVYDACWLRDRCLIVRKGRFFKCTRAAYFGELQARIQIDEPHASPATIVAADGVALDDPHFDDRLLAYMNDPTPLGACQYCHGTSGALLPHAQLTRAQVRSGRL